MPVIMAQKLPLSVAIITFNEAEAIKRTLDSVKIFAGEIIIVDSHSTDNTRDIAEDAGCIVYEEDWKGFTGQKDSALEKCSQPWILMIDADELVSAELADSIAKAISENTDYNGFFINRRSHYLGKLMKYAWQPEWILRLVRKDASPAWTGYEPHSYCLIKGETKKIKGDLIHYSFSGIKHHFSKQIDYAKLAAESYHKMKRKFRIFNLLINPPIAFIQIYFLQLGLLDGIRGFLAAAGNFFYTFLKYAFLWNIERNPDE